jgi:predicted ATP-dependent endonuclease of OLD family
MKIQKITVQNYKAVSDAELTLNGCSAIVTAGNDKGKSSILKGLISRLQSQTPDIIVKRGESKGFNHVELTDGSRIEWNFTEKSESLHYITADGIKITSGVIKQIGERYFGKGFDIDRFLVKSPKDQGKELQNLCGLDFEAIDNEYKDAYNHRTEANRELKRIGAMALTKPVKVDSPDLDGIKKSIQDAKEFNQVQQLRDNAIQLSADTLDGILHRIEDTDFEKFFDKDGAKKYVDSLPKPESIIYISDLEKQLEAGYEQQRKADAYERELNAYNAWITEGKQAREQANKADEAVKAIEADKAQMLANAKLPDGFDITEDGLTYNGFPLDSNQISSSAKYIAALKLGSLALGEIKTLHFDASFLDNANLAKVQEWANSQGLQLLIERPDMDGGEIQYHIIEE